MTISRRYEAGHVVLSCNVCFNPEVRQKFPETTRFADVAAWARKQGWRIKHLFGQHYSHTCPDCVTASLDRIVDRERLHA